MRRFTMDSEAITQVHTGRKGSRLLDEVAAPLEVGCAGCGYFYANRSETCGEPGLRDGDNIWMPDDHDDLGGARLTLAREALRSLWIAVWGGCVPPVAARSLREAFAEADLLRTYFQDRPESRQFDESRERLELLVALLRKGRNQYSAVTCSIFPQLGLALLSRVVSLVLIH